MIDECAPSIHDESKWLLAFDFDRTMSSAHIFKRLAGWEVDEELPGERERARVAAPFAMSERGQLRRLAELGDAWIVEALGGAARIAELRKYLEHLAGQSHVHLIIVTRGFVAPVQFCLLQVGLLALFEHVYGNSGDCYGTGSPYDQESQDVELTRKLEALLDYEADPPWGDKNEILGRHARKLNLGRSRAIMVDDDASEVDMCSSFGPAHHVKSSGLTAQDMQALFQAVGLDRDFRRLQVAGRGSVASAPTAAASQGWAAQSSSGGRPRRRWRCFCCLETAEDRAGATPSAASSAAGENPYLELEMTARPAVKEKSKTTLLRHSLVTKNLLERKVCLYKMPPHATFEQTCTTIGLLRTAQFEARLHPKMRDNYTIQKTLAQGSFGTTYLAAEKASGRLVVVKKPNDPGDHVDFDALLTKTHPHVVRVYDCIVDSTGVFVVLEYCAGGDLGKAVSKLLEKEGSVTANWVAAIFKQILEGVLYLHKQHCQQHNDLKPENVLLESPPKDGHDAPRTMICDFGNAAYDGKGTGGDPRYLAFEVVNGGAVSYASDVWSLGVTLYELLTGELPFINHHNISGFDGFSRYQGGRLYDLLERAWQKMSIGEITEPNCENIREERGRELTLSMMQVDPSKRVLLPSTVGHRFFLLGEDLPGHEHGKHHLSASVVKAHEDRIHHFRLREVLLELVESKIAGEHLSYYADLFDEFDINHDGALDREEFAKVWAALDYPAGIEKPSAEAVFNDVDIDRDGILNFDEFVAFAFDPNLLDETAREQYFHSAFDCIRSSDNGVDRVGFKELFAVEAFPLVDRLFDEIDADHSGKISYEEFAKYVLDLNRPVEEVRRSQRLASSTVGRSSGAGARRLSSAGQVLGNSFVSKRGNSFTANR